MLDATINGGGLSELLLERVGPTGSLVGVDRDAEAIARLMPGLGHDGRVRLIVANFADLGDVGLALEPRSFDAAIFDLGLSSLQLDAPERGFSFRQDGPLDMRFDRSQTITAADLLASLGESELTELLRTWGQERWAAKIARAVAEARKARPLSTTREFASLIERSIPRRYWPRAIHPATRAFQALRIAVNDELGALDQGLRSAIGLLRPRGRLAVISFHSLEDGMVKRLFAQESKDCICPPSQPICTCQHRASLRVLTRRPLLPGPRELAANPRARSARLRICQAI